MNRKEKAFISKLCNQFETDTTCFLKLSDDELQIYKKLKALHIIDNISLSSYDDAYAIIVSNYPLSPEGEEEYTKSIYFKIRDSAPIKIVRDVFLLTAFLASLYITLKTMAGK
jgi:hypothetical protein